MNKDDLDEFVTVTAIVRYDIYPHYIVVKGKLLPTGGVKTRDCGGFSVRSILRILPESEYETQEALRRKITSEYTKKERQLRVDILKENGVDFLPAE